MQKFSKSPEKIQQLFNKLSGDYDKLNDIMSFGLHWGVKKDAIKRVKDKLTSPKKILDLCTGTGDLAGILYKEFPQSNVVGVDFSQNMLNVARKKYPNIEFLSCDCSQLPFEGEQYDLCVISFGLRNTEDIKKVLGEIYRVMKPGGYFVNIDLGKPNRFFNFFLKPYMYIWVSLLGKIFHGDETPYKYLAESNEDFPSPEKLIEMYKEVGFLGAENKNYLFGQVASQTSYK